MKRLRKHLIQTVKLTNREWKALENLDDEYGYLHICGKIGMTKSTYYNILNTGAGREDSILKIRGLIEKHKVTTAA